MEQELGLGLEPYEDLGEDTAMPLITINKKGQLVQNEEALEFLRGIPLKLGVLGVCGKYRTGKSYLLNNILLGNTSNQGFSVGPTINACTKGIWMWKRPFKMITPEDEEIGIILIDTEGLGAFDEDENHDTKIVLLTILLSSLLLYNSMGAINENALQSLSLVVNISKTIQQNNSESGNEDTLAANFPAFLWVLRDFSLQLVDTEGNHINARQYLELALGEQNGTSDNIENKNRIRRLLKHFFAQRDCCTLVRPTEDETDLQNLAQIKIENLRPEFIQHVEVLKNKTKKKLKAKLVNDQKINGSMFADLVDNYVQVINKGKVPNIDSCWDNMCKSVATNAIQTAISAYHTQIQTNIIPKLPLTKTKLEDLKATIQQTVITQFRAKILQKEDIENHIKDLTEKLNEINDKLKKQNYALTTQLCTNYFQNVYKNIQEKAVNGGFENFAAFKEEVLVLLHKIPSEIKESDGFEDTKSEFLTRNVLNSADYIFTKFLNNTNNDQK